MQQTAEPGHTVRVLDIERYPPPMPFGADMIFIRVVAEVDGVKRCGGAFVSKALAESDDLVSYVEWMIDSIISEHGSFGKPCSEEKYAVLEV